MQQSVLILGASGRFGRSVASTFSWAGWEITRFDRKTDRLPDAAWGADVIVNAWNPEYPDWAKLVPEITRQVIATAKETGATVLIPGNLYSYGRELPAELCEATPHAAETGLGLIRKEMEDAYREAGVRTIILRAGDFIDTTQSGNWFDRIITKDLPDGVMTYPGNPTIDHAWAYLPDVAEAAVALLEKRHQLARFEEVSFPGYTLSGVELQSHFARLLQQNIRLKEMAWWPITLVSPVWKMGRHLREMRYLWEQPHRIASAKFSDLLPDFRPTEIEEALWSALPDDIRPDQKMAGALRIRLNPRTQHATI